jgi:hypothetical protein
MKMRLENVGNIIVLDSGLLNGLVIDRQIATKVVAAGKDPTRVNLNEFDEESCSKDRRNQFTALFLSQLSQALMKASCQKAGLFKVE